MAWRPCSGVFPVPHWFLQPGLSLDAHVLNLPAGHSSPVCLDGLLGAEPIALGDGLGLGLGLKCRVDLGDGLGLGHEGCVNHGERVRLGHGFNEGVHKHASDEVVEGLSDVHCIGHGNPVGDGLNVADGIASGIISSIVSRVTLSEQFWLRHGLGSGFSESVLYGISKRHEKPTGERHGVLEQRCSTPRRRGRRHGCLTVTEVAGLTTAYLPWDARYVIKVRLNPNPNLLSSYPRLPLPGPYAAYVATFEPPVVLVGCVVPSQA